MINNSLEKVEQCYVCGGIHVSMLMPVKDRWHGLAGDFNLVKCKGCGLIYTNPRPKPEAMGLYYPDSYGPHQFGANQENGDKAKTKKRAWFKTLLNSRSQYLPPLIPGGNLLEIGCSYGSFLEHAKSVGWDVVGVEIAEEPVKYGRQVLGLNIHHGTLESADFPANCFDVVTGWMVLEHLYDPVGTLKEIGRIIKPGGTVAFGVPNVGSWEFKLFGPNWFALEIPRHLSHFNYDSIRELFARTGFCLEKVYYQKNIGNIPASLALLVEDRFGRGRAGDCLRNISCSGLFHKLAYPVAAMLSWFKMTGRITVVGRIVK